MLDACGAALRIIDDVRDATAPPEGWPATGRLADISYEGAQAKAKLGRQTLARIAALERAVLPQRIAQTLAIVGERARYWAKQDEWYWTVFDPGSSELFAMFAPAPYAGGVAIAALTRLLRSSPVASELEQARYLSALHEFGEALDALTRRTDGQIARGIYMPRAQAESVRLLLDRLAADQPPALLVDDDRLPGVAAFKREVGRVVARRIAGGIDRLSSLIDESYMGRTGERVGLMHYPQGPDIYPELVRLHGSTELSPAEVHELGLERGRVLREGMAAIRREAGFEGDDHAFRAHLDADPAWRAASAEAITRFFERYIERFRPHVGQLFRILPTAGYGVRPLPPALSGAMTFGYYEQPGPSTPEGTYVFNAENLARSGLFNLASLTYHELVPGHHFHLALQGEDAGMPAIRRWCMPTAYVEGWAEYAVSLAEEAGMFVEPAERFGRLVNEAFLVSRLVVDTGLNALGWSLDKARDYMRAESFFPEAEIRSETLRYGADIPGQALAYKLGDHALMEMRAAMRERLGPAFDIRDFHDAVLASGAMPLPLLRAHVTARTDELARGKAH